MVNEVQQQILHLMNEYCYRLDAGDLQAAAELFENGSWGVLGDPAGAAKGSDAVFNVLQNVTLYDGKPLTKHLMSNVEITVDESGSTARARSRITLFQAVPDRLPLQAIFIGDYRDEFELQAGEWRFKLREISPDLIGDLSHHRADM